jgi:hypothetical protein
MLQQQQQQPDEGPDSSSSSTPAASSSNRQRLGQRARTRRNIHGSSSRRPPRAASTAMQGTTVLARYFKSRLERPDFPQTAQMIAYVLSNALVSVVDADTQKNARQQATGYPCLEYMEEQMERTDHPGAACLWQLLFTLLGAVAQQQHHALQGESPAAVSAALLPAAGSSSSSRSWCHRIMCGFWRSWGRRHGALRRR